MKAAATGGVTALPASRLDPATRSLPTQNGKVGVTVVGDPATVQQQTRKLGGSVLTVSGSSSSVLIAKNRLEPLSQAAGVTAVRAPVKAYPLDATSEGVETSDAAAWHQAGSTAAGVTIAVVDVGFTGVAQQISAGTLPSDTRVVNENCMGPAGDPTATDDHGTAVADIVSEMAPAAHLDLYCINDTVGFASAEADIQAAGTKIATSSLQFPGDSRGDGTGATDSASAVVRKARQKGILWIQAAGNEAVDHWSGKLTDSDRDNLIDLNGTADEFDQLETDPGGSGVAVLQWDQWPASSADLELALVGQQCQDDDCDTTSDLPGPDCDTGTNCAVQATGDAPTLGVEIPDNTSQYPQLWSIFVLDGSALPSVRYDLSYLGDVSPSYYASEVDPKRGAAGSISEPASSPYVLAVGAADVGADGVAQGTLEPFSSQGPTIDGRVKPDITGWDGVSSPVYGAPSATSDGGFYGTSAAAPHVAGAAALALAANPNLDAAQLQSFLEQRASSGKPSNPPTNQEGHGLLTLGAAPSTTTPVTAPAGSRYTAITPVRLLDTRTTTGGHKGVVGAGKTVPVKVPASTPSTATAVALNLTGTGATGTTYLSAFPGGTAPPPASNLNLSKTDPTAAVFAVVGINANRTVSVINNAGSVNVVLDEVGYFAPGTTSGLYAPLPVAKRILDTRTTTGNHHGKLAAGTSVTVKSGSAGSGNTAAIVNVTATNVAGAGYLSAGASCGAKTSTLNFTKYTRANLAVVGLTSTGTFCVTAGGHATDVAIDVVGYLGTDGAEFHALPSASRIVDTRTGNGGAGGGHATSPLGAAKVTSFYGADVGDVPADSTALLTGVVEASTTTGSYLALFPGTTKPTSVTSNLNFSTGRVVPNAAVVTLSAGHQFGVFNNAGSTNVAIDVFGYFSPGPAG